jgi:hypothetical protein
MQEETRQKVILAAAAASVVFGAAYFMFFNGHKTTDVPVSYPTKAVSAPVAAVAPKTETTPAAAATPNAPVTPNAGVAPNAPTAPNAASAPKAASAGPKKDSGSEAITSEDAYSLFITERAEKNWDSNPFKLDESIAKLFAEKSGTGKDTFVYSGFIEMIGGKNMAVINDMEFKQGEQISEAGYNLTKITPSFVVIERKKDKAVYKVPFSE